MSAAGASAVTSRRPRTRPAMTDRRPIERPAFTRRFGGSRGMACPSVSGAGQAGILHPATLIDREVVLEDVPSLKHEREKPEVVDADLGRAAGGGIEGRVAHPPDGGLEEALQPASERRPPHLLHARVVRPGPDLFLRLDLARPRVHEVDAVEIALP